MRRILLAFGLVLLPHLAAAQVWTAPATFVTGQLVNASDLNAQIRDNMLVLRAGGFSVTSQAIGDLLCASSTTQFARLADVATGSVLVSGGVGACPSYSTAVPFLTTGNDFSQSTTGANTQQISNSHAAGTTELSSLQMNVDAGGISSTLNLYSASFTTSGSAMAGAARWNAGGVGGINIVAVNGSGPIRFYTGGDNLRWGINAAGDFTFGASSHIADSNGTPTVTPTSGSATISGTDYAFRITITAGTPSGFTVTFGHTWSTLPVCVALLDGFTAAYISNDTTASTTSSLKLQTNVGITGGLFVLCRGY